MKRWLILLTATVWMAVGGARAEEGRRLIAEPTTITESGTYVVTRALSASTTPALTIEADGVTVDLNGFALEAASGSAVILIRGDAAGVEQGITIRNGTLRGGSHGIDTDESPDPGRRLTLRALQVEDSGFNGIVFSGERVDIAFVTVSGAGTEGLDLLRADTVASLTGRVVDCVVSNAGGDGVRLFDAQGFELHGNVIYASGGDGIECAPCSGERIVGNTIRNNTGIGVRIGADNALLEENTVADNGEEGIAIAEGAAGNLIRSNVVSGNGASGGGQPGISVANDNNLVDANLITENSGSGIEFLQTAEKNVYRDNMLLGNSVNEVSDAGLDNDEAGANVCNGDCES